LAVLIFRAGRIFTNRSAHHPGRNTKARLLEEPRRDPAAREN
jgi:hypothetical protein